MANSVYSINKGVNRSVEFKGLRAQYIWYLGGGLVVLLVLFAILYLTGMPSVLCIGIIAAAGTLLFTYIYKLNNRYGEHGLMKRIAGKRIPSLIRSNDRRMFMKRHR